jgi:PIN domain nuclease of toxin-antitoxin system
MRILLDTQIFLWYITGARQIPAPVLQAVRDADNEVFLSVVAICQVIEHGLVFATVDKVIHSYPVRVLP